MKKLMIGVAFALLVSGCGQVQADYDKGMKLEQYMTKKIEAGLSAEKEGFSLMLPVDPIGERIENLPESKYSDALEEAWKSATLEYDFKKANKFLNKAQDIRTGQ